MIRYPVVPIGNFEKVLPLISVGKDTGEVTAPCGMFAKALCIDGWVAHSSTAAKDPIVERRTHLERQPGRAFHLRTELLFLGRRKVRIESETA